MTTNLDSTAPLASDPHPEAADLPLGPVDAAMIAGGLGCLAVGVLTVLAEASASIKDALELTTDVGPLSGKTAGAVAIWLVAWAVLHAAMRRSTASFGRAFVIMLVLVAIGLVLTFPLVFEAFAA